MNISEILLTYDSDKNKGATPEKIGHYYGQAYQEIFDKFDNNSAINILEVGVQKGGSLLAWKQYFPNAYVCGIDIVDHRLEEYKKDSVYFILSDINDLSIKEGPILRDRLFDIIIDDGSHYLEDVLNFTQNYLDKININGYLIIEDVQVPKLWLREVKKLIKKANGATGVLGFLKEKKYHVTINDLRDVNGVYDDFLIIIQKKSK